MTKRTKKPTYIDDHVRDLDMDHTGIGVKQCYLLIFILAFLFLLTSIGLWIASLIDQKWIGYAVDSTTAGTSTTDITFHSRYRGIWLDCLAVLTTQSSLAFIANNLARSVFGACYSLTIQQNTALIDSRKSPVVYSYRLLNQAIALIAAILLFLTVLFLFILSVYWCIKRTVCPRLFRQYLVKIGFIQFLAACFQIILFIVFHQMIQYEKTHLEQSFMDVYSNWDSNVKKATKMAMEQSYYLGWVSILFNIVSLLFFYMVTSAILNWLYCGCCLESAFAAVCCHNCLFFCCKKCGVFHNHTTKCHLTTRRYFALNADKERYHLNHLYQSDPQFQTNSLYLNWTPGWHNRPVKGKSNIVLPPKELGPGIMRSG